MTITIEEFFKAIIDFITDIIAAIYRFMGLGVPEENIPAITDKPETTNAAI